MDAIGEWGIQVTNKDNEIKNSPLLFQIVNGEISNETSFVSETLNNRNITATENSKFNIVVCDCFGNPCSSLDFQLEIDNFAVIIKNSKTNKINKGVHIEYNKIDNKYEVTLNTQIAGIYNVIVQYKNNKIINGEFTFEVLPDNSSISLTQTQFNNGIVNKSYQCGQLIEIPFNLFDKFGNEIINKKEVKVIVDLMNNKGNYSKYNYNCVEAYVTYNEEYKHYKAITLLPFPNTYQVYLLFNNDITSVSTTIVVVDQFNDTKPTIDNLNGNNNLTLKRKITQDDFVENNENKDSNINRNNKIEKETIEEQEVILKKQKTNNITETTIKFKKEVEINIENKNSDSDTAETMDIEATINLTTNKTINESKFDSNNENDSNKEDEEEVTSTIPFDFKIEKKIEEEDNDDDEITETIAYDFGNTNANKGNKKGINSPSSSDYEPTLAYDYSPSKKLAVPKKGNVKLF